MRSGIQFPALRGSGHLRAGSFPMGKGIWAMFLSIGLIGSTADAQRPPVSPTSASPQTVITKVMLEFGETHNAIQIEGRNFGSTPTVLLGESMGTFLDLALISATDSIIRAVLPSSFTAGTYLLVVEAGSGPNETDVMDVTIGAVGPIGPQGPEGAPGPQGPPGPEGPSGNLALAGMSCEEGKFVTGFDESGLLVCGRQQPFATTVFSGRFLRGLAYDSGVLWVLHSQQGGTSDIIRIAKIDCITGELLQESGDLGWNGRGVTVASGSLWVADAHADVIRRLDLADLTEQDSFATPGSEPNGLAFDGASLWLTDPFFERVYRLSLNGAVMGSFPISNSFRNGLEWDSLGLWTNTDKAVISRYLQNGTISMVRPLAGLPVGVQIYDIAIGAGLLYISAGDTIFVQDW